LLVRATDPPATVAVHGVPLSTTPLELAPLLVLEPLLELAPLLLAPDDVPLELVPLLVPLLVPPLVVPPLVVPPLVVPDPLDVEPADPSSPGPLLVPRVPSVSYPPSLFCPPGPPELPPLNPELLPDCDPHEHVRRMPRAPIPSHDLRMENDMNHPPLCRQTSGARCTPVSK
jgi:hypothetical protein